MRIFLYEWLTTLLDSQYSELTRIYAPIPNELQAPGVTRAENAINYLDYYAQEPRSLRDIITGACNSSLLGVQLREAIEIGCRLTDGFAELPLATIHECYRNVCPPFAQVQNEFRGNEALLGICWALGQLPQNSQTNNAPLWEFLDLLRQSGTLNPQQEQDLESWNEDQTSFVGESSSLTHTSPRPQPNARTLLSVVISHTTDENVWSIEVWMHQEHLPNWIQLLRGETIPQNQLQTTFRRHSGAHTRLVNALRDQGVRLGSHISFDFIVPPALLCEQFAEWWLEAYQLQEHCEVSARLSTPYLVCHDYGFRNGILFERWERFEQQTTSNGNSSIQTRIIAPGDIASCHTSDIDQMINELFVTEDREYRLGLLLGMQFHDAQQTLRGILEDGIPLVVAHVTDEPHDENWQQEVINQMPGNVHQQFRNLNNRSEYRLFLDDITRIPDPYDPFRAQ